MRKEPNLPIFDIDCVFQGFGGRGAIYVSNLPAATNYPLLKTLNIQAIISIAYNGFIHQRKQAINYFYIPALDHQSYQISQHFDSTYNFLEQNRKQFNVLVHCMAGKSRSATIVAAYLLKKYKYSLSNVLSLLKRKRAKINPNQGFIKQLQDYSQKIGTKKNQEKVISGNKKKNLYKSCHSNDHSNEIKKIKEIECPQSINADHIKLPSDSSTTQSVQKQHKSQEQITSKLNQLRSKVMKASKMKQNKVKKDHHESNNFPISKKSHQFTEYQGQVERMLESTVSSTLSNAQKISIKWKENKSLQLD